MKVILPEQWDGHAAVQVVNTLDEAIFAEKVTIDFSLVHFVKPYGTLLIADGLRSLVAKRRANALKTEALIPKSDAGALSYLRHIGFFEYIGLSTGKRPGEAQGSGNYVPIRTITMADLSKAARGAVFQLGVQAISDQLAEVVYPRITEQIMMQYCLREVIRNVFEHAETDRCTVLAQRYSTGIAEIAIVDSGIGIYGSLSRSTTLRDVDDALSMALKPGVSRVKQMQNRGEWDNSGYGLYILSQLGQSSGEFVIASNGRYLRTGNQTKATEFGQLAFPGTAIKLVVDLEQADYFPNRLQQLVKAGEQEHFQETGEVKSASKRSKMASTDPEF